MEAITREEKIMSGENLTPITRKEMFLAKAAGMDVETPEPITREEIFLSKIKGGSGGGGGTGGGEEWIGDGKTHLWIKIAAEGRMDVPLYFQQTVANGVTIDWGDGSATETLSGTGKVKTTHAYAKIGDYVICLDVADGCTLELGHPLSHYTVMGYVGNNQNKVYTNMLKKVEVGNGVTSIGNSVFYECYSLASILIPESVTSIGDSAFASCYSLANILIPESVTSIGGTAFYNCVSMKFCDFTKHTAVPTLSNTDAFKGIPSDCEIRVPAALYDEWISATNWSTYADKIVAV